MLKPLSDEANKECIKFMDNLFLYTPVKELGAKAIPLAIPHDTRQEAIDFIAHASQIDTVRQIVELLEKWREQGTHLVSNEAIEELKELVK